MNFCSKIKYTFKIMIDCSECAETNCCLVVWMLKWAAFIFGIKKIQTNSYVK